jgi:hypothetical protein
MGVLAPGFAHPNELCKLPLGVVATICGFILFLFFFFLLVLLLFSQKGLS